MGKPSQITIAIQNFQADLDEHERQAESLRTVIAQLKKLQAPAKDRKARGKKDVPQVMA